MSRQQQIARTSSHVQPPNAPFTCPHCTCASSFPFPESALSRVHIVHVPPPSVSPSLPQSPSSFNTLKNVPAPHSLLPRHPPCRPLLRWYMVNSHLTAPLAIETFLPAQSPRERYKNEYDDVFGKLFPVLTLSNTIFTKHVLPTRLSTLLMCLALPPSLVKRRKKEKKNT